MTDPVADSTPVVLLPDAGPLITLAYGQALDLLLKPNWPVRIVDMVLHEVTRNATPSSDAIRDWVEANAVSIITTRTYQQFQAARREAGTQVRQANLGELAVQEAVHEMAFNESERIGIFLFEDHKIARASFLVPDNCRKISTRAFLLFLEGQGWINSAAEVERAVIAQGRYFSQLRFPP